MKRIFIVYALLLSLSELTASAAWITSGEVIPDNPVTWTSSTTGYIGRTATGELTVNDGSVLLSGNCYIGSDSSANGTATVDGTGSTWTNSNFLYVGFSGSGTLNITGGGSIDSESSYVSSFSGSTGAVTVDGPDSAWTNSGDLYLGISGDGTLSVTNAGSVSNAVGQIGGGSGSTGIATVEDPGSTWMNNSDLYVGVSGNGTLGVANGGGVSNASSHIGTFSGSTGTVTIGGPGSAWITSGDLYLGDAGSGIITQTGGTVTVDGALQLGQSYYGNATYHLSGGTLILKALDVGSGTAAFNFGGGILQASGAFSSSLPMTLTGIGGNATVNTNSYDVTLSGVLSGTGGLNKSGNGTLTLSAKETYSGDTTINGGTLAITGGIDAGGTMLIDVQSGTAILSTMDISKSDLNIVTTSAGMFEVSSGTHTLGNISGSGITQVDTGASLAVASLSQGTLNIGSGGKLTIQPASVGGPGSIATTVPEPDLGILLAIACLALSVYARRR
jgi:T5SS/PEP-CTERM-associated repeat protein/autotransporter-associated beta strand protein